MNNIYNYVYMLTFFYIYVKQKKKFSSLVLGSLLFFFKSFLISFKKFSQFSSQLQIIINLLLFTVVNISDNKAVFTHGRRSEQKKTFYSLVMSFQPYFSTSYELIILSSFFHQFSSSNFLNFCTVAYYNKPVFLKNKNDF